MSDLGRLKENAYDNVSRTITRIFDVPCDATMDSIVYALGEIQAKLCDSNNRLCAALKVPEDAETVMLSARVATENLTSSLQPENKRMAIKRALALIPTALARIAELGAENVRLKARLAEMDIEQHILGRKSR